MNAYLFYLHTNLVDISSTIREFIQPSVRLISVKERECGKREKIILPWDRMMMMGEREMENEK